MSEWYDPYEKRYRTTFIYKLFYGFGWPFWRSLIYLLPKDMAHIMGIRVIRIISIIDTAWCCFVLPIHLIYLFIIILPFQLIKIKMLRILKKDNEMKREYP